MATASTVFERASELPVPAETLYDWHTRPGALERLLQPWGRIAIVRRAGGVQNGTDVELRVRCGPASVTWIARHRDVVPGRQFVDEQVRGPFVAWVHTHRMESRGPDRSLLVDHIEYTPPLGAAGAAIAGGTIRSRLRRTFAYRHALTRDDLASHARHVGPALAVAVSGASGLIGSALGAFLTTGGHRVTRLVRGTPLPGDVRWDPATGLIDAAALEGHDAVVHLAGENLAAGRWTRARKERVRMSRVNGTRLLAESLARLARPPQVLVSASAIGYYGDRGDEILTEASASGDDFLAAVGREWEEATEPARRAGIRVVRLRLGVVLTPAGGALGKMLLPFSLGVAGRLGSGRQWMSWISHDDAIGAIHHAIITPTLEGPVNGVGPQPVTNAEFTDTLGRVLCRPAIIPIPATALRLLLGEMADATLLASTRVVPARLLGTGYSFRHPTLERTLRFGLGREE